MPHHSPNPDTNADKDSMLDSLKKNHTHRHRRRETMQTLFTKDRLLTKT